MAEAANDNSGGIWGDIESLFDGLTNIGGVIADKYAQIIATKDSISVSRDERRRQQEWLDSLQPGANPYGTAQGIDTTTLLVIGGVAILAIVLLK